ncbi:hypothetical protein BC826DRAFT_1028374 [Russula brevipes]|nr:hypothetical protein BC826DRAFT_1028374 [Russula brevipes]
MNILRRRPLMAADWNVQGLAPASERVSHRTRKKGHVSQLAKKREAVPSSHIRNQVPQLAQLKRKPQSQTRHPAFRYVALAIGRKPVFDLGMRLRPLVNRRRHFTSLCGREAREEVKEDHPQLVGGGDDWGTWVVVSARCRGRWGKKEDIPCVALRFAVRPTSHTRLPLRLCLQPYNSQNMDRVNIFLNVGHNIPFLSIPTVY